MVRKIINGIGKLVVGLIVVIAFWFLTYKGGQNVLARNYCIHNGYHDGRVTRTGMICEIHIAYDLDLTEIAPFNPPE